MKHLNQFENCSKVPLPLIWLRVCFVFLIFNCVYSYGRCSETQTSAEHPPCPKNQWSWIRKEFSSPSAILTSYPLNIPSCEQVHLRDVLWGSSNHPLYIRGAEEGSNYYKWIKLQEGISSPASSGRCLCVPTPSRRAAMPIASSIPSSAGWEAHLRIGWIARKILK